MPFAKVKTVKKRVPGTFETYQATASATIARGEVVRVIGTPSQGTRYSVQKATAGGQGPLMIATTASDPVDKLMLVGKAYLADMDTSAGAVGDTVYLSASVAGALTLTPTSEPVGWVTDVATAGKALIAPGEVPTTASSTANSLEIPVVADPGTGNAIPVTGSARIYFDVAATGETNTLAAPTEVGLFLFLCFNTEVAGTDTRIVTAATIINDSGNTTMTFNSPSECIWLRSTEIRTNGTPSFHWLVDVNFGVTLS